MQSFTPGNDAPPVHHGIQKAGGRSMPKLNLAEVKPAVNNFMVGQDAEVGERLRQ